MRLFFVFEKTFAEFRKRYLFSPVRRRYCPFEHHFEVCCICHTKPWIAVFSRSKRSQNEYSVGKPQKMGLVKGSPEALKTLLVEVPAWSRAQQARRSYWGTSECCSCWHYVSLLFYVLLLARESRQFGCLAFSCTRVRIPLFCIPLCLTSISAIVEVRCKKHACGILWSLKISGNNIPEDSFISIHVHLLSLVHCFLQLGGNEFSKPGGSRRWSHRCRYESAYVAMAEEGIRVRAFEHPIRRKIYAF